MKTITSTVFSVMFLAASVVLSGHAGAAPIKGNDAPSAALADATSEWIAPEATVRDSKPKGEAPKEEPDHEGKAGCFSWSYSDGIDTTTVYYHNTCKSTRYFQIHWKNGNVDSYSCSVEKKDGHGHIRARAKPIAFKEVSDCKR